jgi:hypothetical protein
MGTNNYSEPVSLEEIEVAEETVETKTTEETPEKTEQ